MLDPILLALSPLHLYIKKNQSHIKSRLINQDRMFFADLHSQFSTDFREILQTLFFRRIPAALKIA